MTPCFDDNPRSRSAKQYISCAQQIVCNSVMCFFHQFAHETCLVGGLTFWAFETRVMKGTINFTAIDPIIDMYTCLLARSQTSQRGFIHANTHGGNVYPVQHCCRPLQEAWQDLQRLCGALQHIHSHQLLCHPRTDRQVREKRSKKHSF